MSMYNDNLPELLSPKVDIVFKMLFGDERNKDLTIKFISAVLSYKDGEIKDLIFKDTHMKKEFLGDKLEILDVKAELSSGEIIDVEMQSRSIPEIRNRISYYKSNMITEQIGDGGSYLELKPVKSILIVDSDFIHESEKCHTIFQMLEKDEHFPFSNLEEIHVLNLKKLSQLREGSLLGWMKFINSNSKEEFMQVAGSNPVLKTAVDVLSVVSADKENRMLYEARLKAWRDEQSRTHKAVADAWTGGKAEGMQELVALLKSGVSLEEAEKRLGL